LPAECRVKRENREITAEKEAKKAYLHGLSSLAESMVIWEFTLSLAHSLPKMHNRLEKNAYNLQRKTTCCFPKIYVLPKDSDIKNRKMANSSP